MGLGLPVPLLSAFLTLESLAGHGICKVSFSEGAPWLAVAPFEPVF